MSFWYPIMISERHETKCCWVCQDGVFHAAAKTPGANLETEE